MKCVVCGEAYPCKDVAPDRPNPYGWDRSQEAEPIKFWDLGGEEVGEKVKANMEHAGSGDAISSACTCGLTKEYAINNRPYTKFGKPSEVCYRHGTTERKSRQYYRERTLRRGK